MPELIPAAPGPILTPEQYMARAANHELTYAQQSIRDMQAEVTRIKATAQRIIKTCDWLLNAVIEDERLRGA